MEVKRTIGMPRTAASGRRLGLVVAAFAVCALLAQTPVRAADAPVTTPDRPVEIAGARQFELQSKVTGRTYRIFVAPSPGADPTKPAPVVYVLDGNGYFPIVVQAMRFWGGFDDGVQPAIVVGIGYPTDSVVERQARRVVELTPTNPSADDPVVKYALPPDTAYGDVDGFLAMIERELKPLLAARYPVDPSNSVLMGHSLGGLAVVRALLTHPDSYRSYIALSPAIWWDKGVVLKDEPAFLARVRAHQFSGRLYLGVASYDEHMIDPPPAGMTSETVAQIVGATRTVTTTRAFARRVAEAGARVEYDEFADNTHLSVPWPALRPALELALPANP